MIQLVAGDTARSAATADRQWLATHLRIVDGKTVLKVGAHEHTLPRADLSRLIARAASA